MLSQLAKQEVFFHKLKQQKNSLSLLARWNHPRGSVGRSRYCPMISRAFKLCRPGETYIWARTILVEQRYLMLKTKVTGFCIKKAIKRASRSGDSATFPQDVYDRKTSLAVSSQCLSTPTRTYRGTWETSPDMPPTYEGVIGITLKFYCSLRMREMCEKLFFAAACVTKYLQVQYNIYFILEVGGARTFSASITSQMNFPLELVVWLHTPPSPLHSTEHSRTHT